jgi:demethylmenaquinone methyltransferase / 2-methoxy-6-polyprenyl-1,4-benzoquinol methylase
MFGAIARRYDLANHVLSCGIDFYWRKRAADAVVNWRPGNIVDLATGTGDLALMLQKRLPEAEVTGVDFLPEMLELAQRKGVHKTLLADAMKLPFPDASFDCITIAFGLRNMENWRGALAEMSRVLRRDGHLLVLEFSLPTRSVVRIIYRFYLHRCLPLLASFLTRRKSAYDYLGDSIEEFPNGREMIDLIEASGFRYATLQPLSCGIATIYTAQKSPLTSP